MEIGLNIVLSSKNNSADYELRIHSEFSDDATPIALATIEAFTESFDQVRENQENAETEQPA